MNYKIIALLLTATVFFSCHKKHPPALAFYHWRTTLTHNETEKIYLDSVQCKVLYIKVADVGLDPLTQAPVPYSLLDVQDTTLLSGRQWIPCVFITNEVFSAISSEKTAWLARQTCKAIDAAAKKLPGTYTEVQIDCDWSASTREAFFAYLKQLKQLLPAQTALSATIRLHQYKFPEKTGVPPVDCGMLMAYNTGDVEHFAAGHSIYRTQDAEKYWIGTRKPYPLPLDLALPIFSWTLLYRDSLLHKIVPGSVAEVLYDTTRYTCTAKEANVGRYVVRKETFLEGHYLRPGDLLRTETVTPDLLWQIADQARVQPWRHVAFYHLDAAAIRHFSPTQIKRLCETFVQAP
jgi:hypothetical protein